MSVKDNVGIIKEAMKKGREILIADGESENMIKVREDIPFGFKIAIQDIKRNDIVYKYGEPIGIASMDIKKGTMVHVHNMEGLRARGDL
ncbi:MAG: UxaA family hydrolase [Deltaproteobacteria bacterium]|nr:UxaA family hydrolase [Deltaproteobacteria bacterium]